MVNARAKGARGERLFCDWLFTTFELAEKPTRNLDQCREGGFDVDLNPFAFEVKRVEKLHLKKWWLQVKKACPANRIPIVAFKQSRKAWEFLIPARFIGIEFGFIRLTEDLFVKWAKIYLTK